MSQDFDFPKGCIEIPSVKDSPYETNEAFEVRMKGIKDPLREQQERLHRAQILENAGKSPGEAFRPEDELHKNWSPEEQNIRWKQALRAEIEDSEPTSSIGTDRSETGSYIESARAASLTAFRALSKVFGWTHPSADRSSTHFWVLASCTEGQDAAPFSFTLYISQEAQLRCVCWFFHSPE
jgi:hypothetical protein